MLKRVIIISIFIFSTFGLCASKDMHTTTNRYQSENDKAIIVFRKMVKAYNNKDINGFFSYVDKDRFLQDYMTFHYAIEKDMRVYDILSINMWIDKIVADGSKKYLYVTWEKRYQKRIDGGGELYKKGYSRFLFDKIDGKYKLIGVAGNVFWGESLQEWRDDTPKIAGQL